MIAEIITIGNELLIGDTINTNASWIGNVLTDNGIRVGKVVTIADDQQKITDELDDGLKKSDLIIITGGLGPTHDDITKKAVKEYFHAGEKLHQPTLDHIRKIFEKRNIPFSKSNYDQAVVPDNCEVLFNKWGTAPGMLFTRNEKKIAVFPGVPHEMKELILSELLPRIQAPSLGQEYYLARYFLLAGIGESTLSDIVIGEISNYLENGVSLAYLPHINGLTLRVSSLGKSKEEAENNVKPLENHIENVAQEFIYSRDPKDNLGIVTGKLLKERNWSVATAESCTGGLLSNMFTDVPGSSEYFNGGIVAYANEVKINQLNVDERILIEYGAVSREVALQMAKGAAETMNSEIGISTTGIAGPGGGSPEKPVGTVWIGFWSEKEHFAVKLQLTKDRWINKEQSAIIALEILRRRLSGIESFPYRLKPEFA